MILLKTRNWPLRLIRASICLSILLIALEVAAQTGTQTQPAPQPPAQPPTVTATPDHVDTTKPAEVLLRVPDAALLAKVKSVTVGDKTVMAKNDGQIIIIQPPKFDAGIQTVKLLDDAGKPIAQGQLNYEPDQSLITQGEQRRDNLGKSWWYYGLVTFMFVMVLGPFILAIVQGTSIKRAGDKRPLGLPVGSFRSILAYSLVAYLGFYILTSVLSISAFAPPDYLLGIVATVVGFYFGSRTAEEGGADPKAGTVRGIVQKGTNPVIGALIKFKRSDDSTEPYSRISDINGRFEMHGIKPGTYKISASLSGGSTSDEQELAVTGGSDHEITILLKDGTQPDPAPVPPATGQPGAGSQADVINPAPPDAESNIDGCNVAVTTPTPDKELPQSEGGVA